MGPMKASVEILQFRDFKSSNRNFTFVPYGLASDLSKEAVKVHVLHGRKRSQILKPIVNPSSGLGGQIIQWDSKSEHPKSKSPRKSRGDRETNRISGPRQVASVAQVPHASHNLHKVKQGISLDYLELRNPLGEQMKADFGIRSASVVDSTNFLVDHYLSRCGRSRFPRELLASYWLDSATFKAFLTHAATLFTLETGQSPPISVEELMCNALQEIQRRISDPIQSHADGTTLAVAILANVEEGRIHPETAACHWRGLKQLLRSRGDISSLRMHRDLHTMLLWREILTSNSRDFCFGHGLDDHPEVQYCNEHLVDFFNGFATYLAEDNHPRHTDNNIQHFLGAIVNRKIVRHCEWTCSMKRRSEIACLVYLSMLVISATVSAESRRIMNRVKDEVIERDTWGQVSQEELLFVILSEGNLKHEWRCQQLWQISRCIFLTRTLDLEDWKTIRDMLSLFIGIEDNCDSRIEVLDAWESLSKRLLIEDGCNAGPGGHHIPYSEGSPN